MKKLLDTNDTYMNTQTHQAYTLKELGIPGLNVLGHLRTNTAIKPSRWHVHPNCVEIKLILNGYNSIITEEKEYLLKGGDIFFTPANVPHASGEQSKGIYKMYWFQLQGDETSFLFLERKWATKLTQQLKNVETGIYKGINFNRKFLQDMFSLLCSDNDINKYHGITKLAGILHEIIAAKPVIQNAPSSSIQKTINYIQENIYEDIMIEDLAEEAGLSLSRFKGKFQNQIGMPPRLYINTQKIEIAKKLLLEGETITDIAFKIGFNSSSYFANVFKKFTRLSPSEFLAMNNVL